MDAVIKISSSEFTDDFFQKMKQFLKGRNVQITIAVQDEVDVFSQNEPIEAYWNRIDKAVNDIESGKGVVYSMKDLESMLSEK